MTPTPQPGADRLHWTRESLRAPHEAADKAQRVRVMFARIAERYDLANSVNSFGRDKSWRRAAARAANIQPGDAALDVACGTGVLAAALSRAGAAKVVGLDFVPEMLAVARRKFADEPIEWVEGDATALPFDDGSFDVVSIGFGLRNIPAAERALSEFRRVLRPGGRLVVLEFAPPRGAILSRLSKWFIRFAIPLLGRIVTGDRGGAYNYLAASVATYTTFAQVRDAMTAAGFADVRTVGRMAMGAVGVHRGGRS